MVLDYGQYDLSRQEKIRFYIALLLCLGICSYLFYQSLILISTFFFLCKKGKSMFADYCRERRQKRLLQEFRDFLFSLSTSFSTGRHMTEAMKEAQAYLFEIYGQNGLLGREIGWMVKAADETGENIQKMFVDFANRTGLEDILTFSEVYTACRTSGGDMVSAVNKAATLLSEKINLEMEIKTLLSQKKFEGRIIATMPFLMILFLLWMSPEYLQVLYTTFAGRITMTVALGLDVSALLWIERMTNVEI